MSDGRQAAGRQGGVRQRAGFRRSRPSVSLPRCRPGRSCPTSLHAQDTDLERSRRRLEEIRAERDRLQQQQQRLQGQVHDVNDELSNLERQRESTQRIVNEIERQIGGLASQLDRSSAELILAEDNLAERRAVLERRLVDIYKRGPLYTFQVLLAAESFGDLLSRYKYLYLTSRQDRALVTDVEQLRNRVVGAAQQLLDVRTQLDRTREEREAELAKLHRPRAERARGGSQPLQRSARSTERRLTALQKDEARLNGLLAALERARRDDAARGALRGAVAGPGSITTADLGKLDWPVEGTIVYRFGRDTLPSGGVIRWNGVGIARRGGHAGARRWRRARCGWWGSSGPTGSRSSWSTATATTRSTCSCSRPRSSSAPRSPRARRSARWAARTPTTARTCTSRSAGRTRSRSIRRPGCGSA